MDSGISSVTDIRTVATDQRPARRERIDELDMTKGVLVVLMVVYHTFNYSTDYTLSFTYLPFLPPSFILITGFLIGRLYLRSDVAVRAGTSIRLLVRGIRLGVIFTLLNVLAQVVGRHKPAGPAADIGSFFDYWFEIYVVGGASAAFEVLLPIAYLLVMAPVLLLVGRTSRLIPLVVALIAIGGSVLLERWDNPSANLTLLSAGLLGVVVGSFAGGSILRLGRYWPIGVVIYMAYIAIAGGETVLMQMLSAFLAVAAIFSICAALGTNGFSRQRVVTLGKYSLLSYIFQIALLQVLSRLVGRHRPWSPPFFLEMMVVLVSMICVIEATHWLRSNYRPFAAVYDAVLG